MRGSQPKLDRNFVPALPVLKARKRMNDEVRRFFDGLDFLEVETPIAVVSPGAEVHLNAFETVEVGPELSPSPLYLHTSPELAMKRLLARGTGHIYQIARVFRNGERSRTHAPEFSMLEWYRSPGRLEQIMDDIEALIRSVADRIDGPWRPQSFRRYSVSEAFEHAGLPDPLPIEDTDALGRALRVRKAPDDEWEDVFFRALLEHVEAAFPDSAVTILHSYPARMAALARIDPKNPTQAERFEVYAGQLELGNAYFELDDAEEQRRRFVREREARQKKGAPLYPIDEAFLRELPNMGEAAGIAVGLDRLLMCCLGRARIQDVMSFSPREEEGHTP